MLPRWQTFSPRIDSWVLARRRFEIISQDCFSVAIYPGLIGRNYSRGVVALYGATGGMMDGESDSRMWSLWSLNRVVSENSRYERPYIRLILLLRGLSGEVCGKPTSS